jgi:cell division protein FtsQ
LSLAALVVCIGFVWWFFISPAMVPASVSISGFPGLTNAQVLRQAGIRERATYLSVNASRAQTLLSRNPLVESARVVKTFPDRIFIHLEPREAVAVSVARIDGRMQPVYFDRYGFAFMFGDGPGIPPPPGSIPVVSGLYRDELSLELGMRLPEALLPLFSKIGEITDSDKAIWQAISEIVVEWNEKGTYDLVLYPTNSLVRIRMGSDMDAGAIRYALLMLDVVRGKGNSDGIDEIDARSGIGVLRGEGDGFGR